MRYDIRFPADTKGWKVAAGLDVCYRIPTNLVHVNREVDTPDVLAAVTDDATPGCDGDFCVRLQASSIEFVLRVGRHSPLAVAMNLCRYLKIPAILPGPGLAPRRFWFVRPDRTHRVVTLDADEFDRGVHVVTNRPDSELRPPPLQARPGHTPIDFSPWHVPSIVSNAHRCITTSDQTQMVRHP